MDEVWENVALMYFRMPYVAPCCTALKKRKERGKVIIAALNILNARERERERKTRKNIRVFYRNKKSVQHTLTHTSYPYDVTFHVDNIDCIFYSKSTNQGFWKK